MWLSGNSLKKLKWWEVEVDVVGRRKWLRSDDEGLSTKKP